MLQDKSPPKDLRFFLNLIFNWLQLRYIFESRRRTTFLLFDILISVVSYWAAFALRFDIEIPQQEVTLLKVTLPLIVVLRIPCFIYFGLYETLWQYVGIPELFSIIGAATAGSVLLLIVSFFLGFQLHPRSVLVMDWLMLIMVLSGVRILFRVAVEKWRDLHRVRPKRVLIIGAESTAEFLVMEFLKQPSLGYQPIGLIDDDPKKLGARIRGVKVIGKISQLTSVARAKKAEEVIIVLPKASREEIKQIIKSCRDFHLICRVVSQEFFLLPSKIRPLKLRPVNISDLLGRELIQESFAGIEDFFRGKCVLITGAGGSIGSELVKMICQTHPQELILIDNSENNLHEISKELEGRYSNIEIYHYLLDITNGAEMEKIFVKHGPKAVYHAAAYKHVPLVELHFREGIINNVLGTKVIADLSFQYGVECFMLISTDKAIRPRSVMGATKRIAEIYVQSLKGGQTRFLTVRFGNVFDSSGSVVSVFRKQIEEGKPLTVTHPEARRYFMDVSEAVFLILQATILGSDSEIFVLDMGKPIKIVDLAHDLAQLVGIKPENVPIEYIGLRPGDKLDEELELNGEQAILTKHKKIKIWKSKQNTPVSIRQQIDELIDMVEQGCSRNLAVQKLKDIVPEYEPWRLTDELVPLDLISVQGTKVSDENLC